MLQQIVYILAVSLLFMGTAIAERHNFLTPDEKKAGWELLFDGETLNCWQTTSETHGWKVEDGAIVNYGRKQAYLATEEVYGNFTFSLEFKLAPKANSGIFFRWPDLKDRSNRGAELQLIDSTGVENPGKGDCGAIYMYKEPRFMACNAIGEWNKVELTVRNNLIWVDMNGKRIIYMNIDRWATPGKNPDGTTNKFEKALKDLAPEGYLAFQDYGDKVWFRNIKIRRHQ